MLTIATMRAARAVEKARCERVGGIPYGYRLAPGGKHLDVCPDEQVVVERVRELRREGESLRAIGRTLLSDGHRPRRGRNWHVQVVARLVGGA